MFGYDLFEPMRELFNDLNFKFDFGKDYSRRAYGFKEKLYDYLLWKYIEFDTQRHLFFNKVFDKESQKRIIAKASPLIRDLFDFKFGEMFNVKLIKKKNKTLEGAFV